jgi:hypothetical protein
MRGSPTRKTVFYSNSAMQKARQSRYRIDGSILADARRAVAESREGVNVQDASYAVFLLGFFLLWQGELAESRVWLEAALADAERTGQAVLLARCLCYLNVNCLRAHDVEGVRSVSPRALGAAEAAGFPEYVAAAKACMAWVAWKGGDHAKTRELAHAALELWAKTVVSYGWYSLALWPLIAVRLAAGEVADAVDAARQLLVPPQHRLADEMESLLQSVAVTWDAGDHDLAAAKLAKAVALAEQLAYA